MSERKKSKKEKKDEETEEARREDNPILQKITKKKNLAKRSDILHEPLSPFG